ncbi:MAG TPA: EamA family transporter [Opitutaceae bacterium]|nr:EamA family transporter [Opitutaceae bacterium]
MIHLVVVSLLWAFSFGLIKTQLAGVDSAFVAGARLVLALAVFLPFLRPRATSRRAALGLIGIGAVQFGLMYLAYLSAFRSLAAYQVALLTIVTPVLVCLVDDLLERRIRWQPLCAAAVAVAGAGVVVAKQPLGRAEWTGIALVQASNICFALGQVLYRRWKLSRPEVRDRDVFAWLYLGAALATLPLAWHHGDPLTLPRSLAPAQLGVLVYLGVLASGLAFFLWNLGAVRVSTGTLAVMNNAKTPLGVAASLLVFGEQTDLPRLLLGGGLVVAAAAYAQWLEHRG